MEGGVTANVGINWLIEKSSLALKQAWQKILQVPSGFKEQGMLHGDMTRFQTTILIGENVVNIGATALGTKLKKQWNVSWDSIMRIGPTIRPSEWWDYMGLWRSSNYISNCFFVKLFLSDPGSSQMQNEV
ncbi:hypothetical protein GIB67_042436 [Kingdonia uniflora]|uniref:Uncharacterized protein n=1 Tax=Kingdonia uniflora TaxID=39325 RepID=A0A7J7M883_9MAGN|nr:hypothetical protein GIB67_042436 [Kingdonia uniflora]